MKRERAKELLPIIEAFANGEDIQFRGNYSLDPTGEWVNMPEDERMSIQFPRDDYEYRIQPKEMKLPLEIFLHINRKTGKVVGWNHKFETMHQDPKIIHKLFREVIK